MLRRGGRGLVLASLKHPAGWNSRSDGLQAFAGTGQAEARSPWLGNTGAVERSCLSSLPPPVRACGREHLSQLSPPCACRACLQIPAASHHPAQSIHHWTIVTQAASKHREIQRLEQTHRTSYMNKSEETRVDKPERTQEIVLLCIYYISFLLISTEIAKW